jgi:2-polyprenyl-3-methyl-5-hydroxy-6-metoxy-1,4-benzoquinol methylase
MNLEPVPQCYLCGESGRPLYVDLRDRLHDTPGLWRINRCPNERCGLVWLDPRPAPADMGQAYAAYFTHSTGRQGILGRVRRRMKRGFAGLAWGYRREVSAWEMALALPLLALPFEREQIEASSLMYLRGGDHAGRRLLEIGCGSGAFLLGMKELGWQVEGIDTDQAAIDIAQKAGLEAHTASLADRSYPEASFDVVAMSHVLEHVYDPIGVLRECRRILRDGGRLVVTTPNIASLGHRRLGSNWLHLDPPRHLHLFSRETLTSVAERAGFQVSELRSTTRLAVQVWGSSSAIGRTGRTSASERSGMMEWIRGVRFRSQEHALLESDAGAGEELMLMATR